LRRKTIPRNSGVRDAPDASPAGTGRRVLATALLGALLLSGCAANRETLRTEEIINEKAGEIPFALRFPSPLPGRESDVPVLAKKTAKSVEELWFLARYYHVESKGKNRLALAKPLYEEIARRDPQHRHLASTNLACLLTETGQYRQSERLFQDLIRERSPIATTYYNLYILYKYARREADGVKVLLLMKERFPESIYAPIELGDIFMEKENYPMAEQFYREALTAGRDNPLPLYRMARVKEKTERYAEAESYYELCLDRFPYFHYAYPDYSNLLLYLGKKEKAKEVLKRGLRKMDNKELQKGLK
jgi:tetratricopeptide (TPR) repeat protein